MNPETEITILLRKHGAVLIRQRKHHIWRLPDGRVFTVPGTPSDYRTLANTLQDLRALLGEKRVVRKNPCRRDKPGVPGKPLYQSDCPFSASETDLLSRYFLGLEREEP